MFGFSIFKLLALVAILAAVWYGFKWLERAGRAPGRRRRVKRRRAAKAVEDMVECPHCSTYVAAAGARSCDRDGCPY